MSSKEEGLVLGDRLLMTTNAEPAMTGEPAWGWEQADHDLWRERRHRLRSLEELEWWRERRPAAVHARYVRGPLAASVACGPLVAVRVLGAQVPRLGVQ